jgi:hypothetical protein
MKLNISAGAATAAVVTAGLYTLCALFIAIAPETAYAVFGFLSHANLTNLAINMTWGVYLGGLVVWTAGAWSVTALAAAIYNRLARA